MFGSFLPGLRSSKQPQSTRVEGADIVMQSSSSTYNSCTGTEASSTDENSQTTTHTYDYFNRLTSTSYPDGGSTTTCYSEDPSASCYSSSLPFEVITTKAISSGRNLITTQVLDGLGRVAETQLNSDPQGADYTDTTYDGLDHISTVTNPYRSGDTLYTTSYAYDGVGRVTQVTKQDNSVVTTQYCGSDTLVTDEALKWRRSDTDGLGRLIEVDEPNSASASVGACPASGDSSNEWQTLYTYDALNDLTSAAQGGSRSRSFTYNSLKQLTISTNPESGTICYGTLSGSTCQQNGYDGDANVIYKTDARSITTTYSYDALNRPTGMTYSNGDPSVGYTYDQTACLGLSACYNTGHRTTMTDGGGTENLAYDKMGREWAEQRTVGSITKSTTYTYDLAGDLATLTYPSGRTITYTYDSAGRPSDAVDTANSINYAVGTCSNGASSPSPATGACYAATGALAQLQNGTNLVSTYLYNSRLQPCWIYTTTNTALPTTTSCTAADPGPGNILDLQYNFNLGSGDNGNVMGITNNRDATRSQTFSYDQVNRLLTAAGSTYSGSHTHCWGETYTYDQWANLYSIGVLSSAYNGCTQDSLSVTVTTSNQLSATGYSYDASGNMLTDGSNTYTYNGESEIATAAGVTYTYDGDGNRVEKSNGVVYWYGAGTEILDESNFSGTFTNEYVFFGGKRIAQRVVSSGNINYYEEDMLGSSRTIVQAGQTSPCYDSDFRPFGSELSITNSCLQNYKFEGKERDRETGNDDFGARYYNSRIGRWLSADWSAVPAPVPYANLTNPQTLNLYAMVSDNPETFADLDGHGPPQQSGAATQVTTCGQKSSGGGSACTTTTTPVQSSIDQEDAQKKAAQQQPAQENNTTGYSTAHAAAKAALSGINPKSIKKNKEYAGLIYKDSAGKFHYTDPKKGKGTTSDIGTAPEGTTVVGDYHTHGDYSRPILFGLFVVRTSATKDAYDSDHFSDTDMSQNRESARSNPEFRGYLGTPSGALLVYNPITDREGPLQ
jgi:RHS repeat-associated protein